MICKKNEGKKESETPTHKEVYFELNEFFISVSSARFQSNWEKKTQAWAHALYDECWVDAFSFMTKMCTILTEKKDSIVKIV